MELTPEEKEAKAKLRIEALERELGGADVFLISISVHLLFPVVFSVQRTDVMNRSMQSYNDMRQRQV